MPRLKLVFWLGNQLKIFIGIVTFLIKVSTSYVTYFAIWLITLLVTAINIDGIDFGSGNKVVLRFPALLTPILIAITLIFLFHFAGFISRLIN